MKKLILLTFVFISNFAFAKNFYIYYQENSKDIISKLVQLDTTLKSDEVYSVLEKKMLTSSDVHANILRVSTQLSLKRLTQTLPHLKIEPVQNVQLKSNDYSDSQWHLNNTGQIIPRWISDIDQINVIAKIGEDIQIQKIVETNKVIKVAVIDSGLDINHPELKEKINYHPSECEMLNKYNQCLASDSEQSICHTQFAQVDSNNNGYPLDCHGWSMTQAGFPGVEITGSPKMNDQNGHGTHVAGLIAAAKDKSGTSGIINHVKIIPIQVAMNSASDSPIENIAKGMLYAIKAKAQVINLSLGWRTGLDAKIMRDMVKLAISKNILVVVAAGNDAHGDISYPCAYEDVICVAAHTPTGKLATYSNHGTQVDVIAPGDRLLSTWPLNLRSKYFTQDTNFEYLSGTSQAAPVVAGALALLLNQNISPSEARVKLLSGARSKQQKSAIRHGNIDVKKALKVKVNSFLYPLNKTPYLVKWEEKAEHKFKMRIKNYGKSLMGGSLKVTALSKQQKVVSQEIVFEGFTQNEIKEFDIFFTDQDELESEFQFKLEIITADESKEYTLDAHYIRLIEPTSSESDIVVFNNIPKLPSNAVLRPFNNITGDSDDINFFISFKQNDREYISVLKQSEDQFMTARPVLIKERQPVFLNFSKVDLDGDKKDDYVIMYVYIDKEQNKTTKFIIFDHEMKPKKYLISPKNIFPNDKTFIPGKFKWLKLANKMIPAWIGWGEVATDHHASPWSSYSAGKSNYFYYLSETGLKNFKFAKDEILLHSLYQSPQMVKRGIIDFISTRDVGFKKDYLLYHFDNGVKLQKTINLTQYFDMMDVRGLKVTDQFSSIFFNEESLAGSQNILSLTLEDGQLIDTFIHLKNPIQNESIKFVSLITENYLFYQTNHKLVVLNRITGENQIRESKVNTKRRKYTSLHASNSLYLPAIEAPGLTSEVLRLSPEGTFFSDARYRTLAVKGCEEFGLLTYQNKNSIGYFCHQDNKLLLLNIQ